MSCYVHHVPGRLRVRIPAAKGNPIATERLTKKLNELRGIRSVAGNPITGSILIRYDTSTTNAAACLAILDIKAKQKSQSGWSKITETIIWYALEKALERGFLLVLAAIF
jgi:hypothetical protein